MIYNHPIHQRRHGNPPTEVFDPKAFAKNELFVEREAELLRGICPFCIFGEPLQELPEDLWECRNCLRIFYVEGVIEEG